MKDVRLKKICDLELVIICRDYQQDFHVEEEERNPQRREFSNIASGSLGYGKYPSKGWKRTQWDQSLEESESRVTTKQAKTITTTITANSKICLMLQT